jgi:hypothetical protein
VWALRQVGALGQALPYLEKIGGRVFEDSLSHSKFRLILTLMINNLDADQVVLRFFCV